LSQDPTAARLSLPTILAFSGTSLPLAALVLAVAVHLPRYFASHLGVSLTVVGAAFALVRLIDIPLDPALGVIMDRTRTRFGRYRLWTLIGAPILMVALYMLFMAPPGVGRSYLMVWLLVMYLGTSILILSHSAWAASLATSYNERARIFGIMAAVGVLGSVMVLIIPIVMHRQGFEEGEGVRAMGWFLIAMTPLAVGVVVWRTPEKITRQQSEARYRLADYAGLFRHGNVWRIMAADLCLALGPGWMSALYIYFSKDSRGYTVNEANLLLVVYILAGVVGAPTIGRLANRISKHTAMMAITGLYSLTLFSLLALPRGQALAAAPVMFLTGFLAAGFTVTTRAITADVGDEVRLHGGKEQIGLLYALTSMTSKVAGAFSIFLTYTVLARIGFDPKEHAVNTADAIRGLEIAFLSGPILFVALGGACFVGYKLSAERHAEIRAELDARDALYDEAPVLEGLTSEPAQTLVESR
jgi:GPH family glycoside/pentoside/hexuronide:cation symporter